MFVYLDESGDCGFRFRGGSSTHFIVGLVITEDRELIEARVREYRTSKRLPENFEFKFYKMNDKRRIEFLDFVSRLPIRVRILVIDKRLMNRPHMKKRETFYGFLLKMMLENTHGSISDADLIIDESNKDKKGKQSLSSYLKRALRGQGESAVIKSIKHEDSRSLGGLQVADVIVGAANRCHQGGDPKFLRVVRNRIEDEWIWRPYSNH